MVELWGLMGEWKVDFDGFDPNPQYVLTTSGWGGGILGGARGRGKK